MNMDYQASSAKKVAVIVHNDVIRDARILKEVKTLGVAGFVVDVYGASNSPGNYPPTIAGARSLTIVNVGVSGAKRRFRQTVKKMIRRLLGKKTVEKSVSVVRERRWKEIARKLSEQVSAHGYDVIHCHDINALIAGTELKKVNPGARLIWDAHEIYEHLAGGSADDKALVRSIIEEATPLVDGFVTISESLRRFYNESYDLPQGRVVMNATRKVSPVEYDGRLHQAAGLERGRKILLFQGALSPHRGIEKLLAAAPSLPEPWSVVFMGWGTLEQTVREAANKHPGRISIVPGAPHSELAQWTAGATIGIIPYENTSLNHLYCTPNKLWEFPAAGVPILATALVEMEQMITRWGTGFLLPREFTAADIVGAVSGITDDQLAHCRQKCRDFVEQMSWESFEPELLELYRDLLPQTEPIMEAASG